MRRPLLPAALAVALVIGLLARGPHPHGAGPVPEVVANGARRVETCLRCHADVRGLGPEHDPAALGCSSCHLGDPTALDAAGAHRGMEVLAGDLATASRTCGRAGCHADEAARVARSLMAGAPGILAVDRFAFGERADPTPRPEDDLRRLSPRAPAASPAEDHARKLCGSCHLAARKPGPGDHGFASRGGGCAACHLAPPHERARAARGRVHPDVSAVVPDARCTGCHARSGRIALSYRGVVELEPGDPRVTGALPDGRPTGAAPADVHARAGLGCVDCHTERDLMGDGRPHAFAADAVGVACEDCHAPAARTPDADAARVADRLRAGWTRRGMPALPPDARALVTRAGVPLWRSDRTRMALWLASSGERRAIPPSRPGAHHALPGHARLTCQACHTAWAPRCGRCHVTLEPGGRDLDHLAGTERPGRWREEAGANGFGPPLLALDSRGRIAPFVEGMRLRIDGLARPVERTLWAPLDAHTTGAARSCASCHGPDALAATYPAEGETTRPGARLLDATERARIAAVGRCARCHDRYDDAVYGDFAASAARAATLARRPRDPHAAP